MVCIHLYSLLDSTLYYDQHCLAGETMQYMNICSAKYDCKGSCTLDKIPILHNLFTKIIKFINMQIWTPDQTSG